MVERVVAEDAVVAEASHCLERAVAPTLVVALVAVAAERAYNHLALILKIVGCGGGLLVALLLVAYSHLDVAFVGTLRHEAV